MGNQNSETTAPKQEYVPSLIIYGGDENWKVLRPKKLVELLVTGCIRKWMEQENISLNQPYNADAARSIIDRYQWLYSIYYSQDQLNALNVGDEVDYRLNNGRYVLVKITHREGTKLTMVNNSGIIERVHKKLGIYENQWSIDYSLKKKPKRFAKPKSISQNTSFASKRFTEPWTNGGIFVNPWGKKGGWRAGKVIDKDQYAEEGRIRFRIRTLSKQILVAFEENGRRYQWWAHLDDHEEIAQFMDEPKVWQIAFGSKPKQKRYGPFAAGQLQFIYLNNRYNLFKRGLYECQGNMKIKKDGDNKWIDLDETGIYLLMSKHCSLRSIKQNQVSASLKALIKQTAMRWIYRKGTFGTDISGLYLRDGMIKEEWKKNKSGIYIKRVGEKGWFHSNDSDLTILFYHLSRHKEVHIPLGIDNVADRMKKAHTQCLTPFLGYDEWTFIRNLMKNMEVGEYYGELQKLGFKNADSIIKDLEPFIFSRDYKANGSKIMEHFNKNINDNDRRIKVGYIIFASCKLMPALKCWTDLLNKNYLEKNFSFARCPDHVNICCCIVQRLMPLNLFTYLYNRDVCYIPGQINNASIYWITCSAFISSLPHYNIDLFRKDWEHFNQCMETQLIEVAFDDGSGNKNKDDDDDDDDDRKINDDDDDDDNDDDDDFDDDFFGFGRKEKKEHKPWCEVGEVDLFKIFSYFTENIVSIKCFVEDCHTMNRKCFPPRSHKPFPIPSEYGDGDRRKVEYRIIDTLDSLHNMMHHVSLLLGTKVKMELKLMTEKEYKILRVFTKTRQCANEKYKGIVEQPKRYYYEDNIVGWNGIKNVEIKKKDIEFKETEGFVKKVIAESRCQSFEEMDICLNRYYKLCGNQNYFNSENEGKLTLWAEDSGYEFDDIIDEFESEAQDCMLVEFDYDDNGNNNFPFINNKQINDETIRNIEIFKIMKNCFKYTNAYQHGMDLINNDGVVDDLCVALCTLH